VLCLLERSLEMSEKINPEPRYGIKKRMVCALCRAPMRITRRSAHPTRGPKYELQTFTCPKCGHVQKRETASPGGVL
jgi:RNase P subunit RPR2